MPKRKLPPQLADPGPRPADEDLSRYPAAGHVAASLHQRNPELVEWERRVASIVDGHPGSIAHPLLTYAGMWPPLMLPEEVEEVKAEFRDQEVVLSFVHDPFAYWVRVHDGRLPFLSRYNRGVTELERDRRRRMR